MANDIAAHPWGKFVPFNEHYRNLYQGDEDEYFKAIFTTICDVADIAPYTEQFDLSVPTDFSIVEIGSNPVLLRFWEFITQISGAKRILEIGTFVGLSAMAFAKASGPDGRVVTVEKFDYFADFAARNFEKNSYADRIELLVADAFEILDELKSRGPYDIIFIDGNKERYDEYFLALEDSLAPNGIVIVDDCFFHGDALNETPQDEKGAGVKRMLKIAQQRTSYSRIALPIGNGALLLRKNQ